MLKKTIGVAVMGLMAFASVASAKADKVEVCHVTGSEKNPVVLISVSSSAVDAHLGHGDTLLPEGQTECGDGSPN